ncbi:unnamed protein product [Polarella glacialis]|uniref:Major facilitator superfamily (MFS) profile domain-containing protein n=1 Tax=Polarella glacialis TaxID=89957 RepID=A0A813H0J1_POLGL|nr:unnamed protein product [Polarella glacialis]
MAAAGDETKGKHVSLSEVMEGIGLTAYHWRVITLVWVIWAMCGWSATSVVFLLDAAGERDSDWVQLTSPENVMTMGERSLALLAVSAIACLANIVAGSLSDMTGRIWLPAGRYWVEFCAAVSLFPLFVALFMRWHGGELESPRWLAVNGYSQGCIALLRLAADSKPPKDQKLPRGWDDPARLTLDTNLAAVTTIASSQNWHERLSELMQPELRFLVCVCGIWTFGLFFVSQGLFYWLITYFKRIGVGAAVSPSMMAAPIANIVVNVALIIGGPGKCIVDSCPRVPLLQAGFIGFAFFISMLAATTNTCALVGIVFMSQIFEQIIWSVGGVYLTEAFPTAVRASGQGAVMAFGNCGAIASAGLVGPLMEIWVYLPIVTMASLLCACCLATFLMKEISREALITEQWRHQGKASRGMYKVWDEQMNTSVLVVVFESDRRVTAYGGVRAGKAASLDQVVCSFGLPGPVSLLDDGCCGCLAPDFLSGRCSELFAAMAAHVRLISETLQLWRMAARELQ